MCVDQAFRGENSFCAAVHGLGRVVIKYEDRRKILRAAEQALQVVPVINIGIGWIS